MINNTFPRLVIAGLGGDSGKTIVAVGLINAFMKMGLNVAPFKKGPDYIDPAWLKLASGKSVRNLDSYLMESDVIRSSFFENSIGNDISIVEGNRGLYDGMNAEGTHSTAELAKMIGAPVIIVQTVKKVTRTAAAAILGCSNIDPDVNIAGVILNRVAGKRHEKVLRESIEGITGIPVVGAIPEHEQTEIMPSRHLGLVMPGEYNLAQRSIEEAGNLIGSNVDLDRLLKIARSFPVEENFKPKEEQRKQLTVNVGYFDDRVFSFYYPENLEKLEELGGNLIPVSSIDDDSLPDELDALYIGGGFPETNAEMIASNQSMIRSVRSASEKGLPIYAECGGLIYLGSKLIYNEIEYPLAGIFPVVFKMEKKPQGHGYMMVKVTEANPFFDIGDEMKGHEFHYSHIIEGKSETCFDVLRGKGAFDRKDGLFVNNTFGTYFHLHANSQNTWASSFIRKAKEYKKIR